MTGSVCLLVVVGSTSGKRVSRLGGEGLRTIVSWLEVGGGIGFVRTFQMITVTKLRSN